MAWYHVILYWMTHARMHAWDIHGKNAWIRKRGSVKFTQQVLAALHVCKRKVAHWVLEINSLQLF